MHIELNESAAAFTSIPAAHPRPRKLRLLRWLPASLVTTHVARDSIALTFDDGPHPEHTPRLLDLLARHDIKATFFVVGDQAARFPALMQRMVKEGHALANHSWDHPHFRGLSATQRREQIDRTDALLQFHDGQPRHHVRPPRGALSVGLLMDCMRRGSRVVYWSYDSLDYGRDDAAGLIASIRARPVSGGDIVLLHDDSAQSHTVLEAMIPQWIGQGYRFVPLQASSRRGDRS